MDAEIFCYMNPKAANLQDRYPVSFFQSADRCDLVSFSVDDSSRYAFVFEVADLCKESFVDRGVLLKIPGNQFVLHSNKLGVFNVQWRSVDISQEGSGVVAEWLFQGERIDVIFN